MCVFSPQNIVRCPERLLQLLLAQIHYMPDHWKGAAHTFKVRDEFARLFQYKLVSTRQYKAVSTGQYKALEVSLQGCKH